EKNGVRLFTFNGGYFSGRVDPNDNWYIFYSGPQFVFPGTSKVIGPDAIFKILPSNTFAWSQTVEKGGYPFAATRDGVFYSRLAQASDIAPTLNDYRVVKFSA